jgi:uncharacterized membrane protein required for colicin V production
MVIDIILVSIIVVWGVFGYRQGFIRRAFTLAGVILVALFSAPLANILNAVITTEFNIPLNEHYAKTALLAASACIIFVLCFLVGKFLHNTLVKGINMAEKTNHVLGMILGIIESSLAIYFVLGVILIHIDKIETYAPSVAQEITQSKAGSFVAENNFVESFELFSADVKAKALKKPQSEQQSSQTEGSPDTNMADSEPKEASPQDTNHELNEPQAPENNDAGTSPRFEERRPR